MGYDMYIQENEPAEEAAREEAATPTRDYFQLNNRGMAAACHAMRAFGMLDEETMHEPFPHAPAYGRSQHVCPPFSPRRIWKVLFRRTVSGVTEGMREYGKGDPCPPEPRAPLRAAEARITDAQAETPTGIPAYKFGSNDGWLVTPDELTAALAAYDACIADGVEPPSFTWWGDWIDYLRRAARHGGFRVY